MQRIPLDQLHEDPDNHPPRDAALVSLLIDAAQGRCKLYLAIVPIQYIRPFSPTYKPTSWEPWLGLLNQSKATLASGRHLSMLTYQVGDFFVMSDDYATYYACLESGQEHVPCYVLGEPRGDHVHTVREATEEELQRQLGLA